MSMVGGSYVEGRRACESVILLIACRDLAQGVGYKVYDGQWV
jgi:hypothetical protein